VKSRLDWLTNVALLLVCLMVGANSALTLAQHFGAPKPVTSSAAKPASSTTALPALATFEVGKTAPPIPGVTYQTGRSTVVLFVRSTCHYCTESMPFYQALAAIGRRARTGARIVAVSSEPEDTLRAYLRSHALDVDSVVSLPENPLGLRATPTLLVIDRAGTLVDARVGRLPEADQQAVIARVAGPEIKSQEN